MRVVFGRGNGEKTIGEIVKINPAKAKVKTLEARGNGRGSVPGTVWNVPYELMSPEGVAMIDELNSRKPVSFFPQGQAAIVDPSDLPLPYSEFIQYGDRCIMEAIVDTYNRLSPEFLTADGERPVGQVVALRNKLNARLRALFQALGRPVSEAVAYQWDDERRAAENAA
jgi:hypothetical protein